MVNWDAVRLVVFDVDGTLYDQRALRGRMAVLLLRHCMAHRSLSVLRLLKAYRQRREGLALRPGAFSEDELLGELATEHGLSKADVHAIVDEWIQRRPLREIARLRYPGVAELFRAIKDSGRTIGILSDHPAREKIRALDLRADHILSADDDEVKSLKPNPRGLQILMEKSDASPETTIMIGDRPERDGEMGRLANVRTYIRSGRMRRGWSCFASFADLAAGLSGEPIKVSDVKS